MLISSVFVYSLLSLFIYLFATQCLVLLITLKGHEEHGYPQLFWRVNGTEQLNMPSEKKWQKTPEAWRRLRRGGLLLRVLVSAAMARASI